MPNIARALANADAKPLARQGWSNAVPRARLLDHSAYAAKNGGQGGASYPCMPAIDRPTRCNHSQPTIPPRILGTSKQLILDGEVVALDDEGRINFLEFNA